MAPAAFAASVASTNSGRLVSRIATRSPGATPSRAKASASAPTRSCSSRQVIVRPSKRMATPSGSRKAWRARWSTQFASENGSPEVGMAGVLLQERAVRQHLQSGLGLLVGSANDRGGEDRARESPAPARGGDRARERGPLPGGD